MPLTQFIPQIYHPNSLGIVKELGFEDVILTTYRLEISDEQLIDFLNNDRLYALTVPPGRITAQLLQSTEQKGVTFLTHTINDAALAHRMMQSGIDGFYTDYLIPMRDSEAS